MTEQGPLWRAIIWIERFLPAPAPVAPEAEPSAAARRRKASVPLLILLTVVGPMLVRQRHELGELVPWNLASVEQLTLVMAVCVAIAAIAGGVKAWYDAKGDR